MAAAEQRKGEGKENEQSSGDGWNEANPPDLKITILLVMIRRLAVCLRAFRSRAAQNSGRRLLPRNSPFASAR